MKVMYKGNQSKVRHRGKFTRGRHNEYPLEFPRNCPVEVTDPGDQAMFQRMAKTNPETWEIVDTPAKKVVTKLKKTVTGE